MIELAAIILPGSSPFSSFFFREYRTRFRNHPVCESSFVSPLRQLAFYVLLRFRMQYLLAFLVVLLAYANADLYSSIADMQSLVDSQRSIPDILYRYIETERRRLDQLME